MRTQEQFFKRYLSDLPSGQLQWIGLRPARLVEMIAVEQVLALANQGLEGDRRCQGTAGSGRQVTLISAEHIQVIRQLLQRDTLEPALMRRNLMISGINLNNLRHQYFKVGTALLYGTSPCHPCSRMDKVLGKGGAAAMMGHGGLCAKIIHGGWLRVGDKIQPQLSAD